MKRTIAILLILLMLFSSAAFAQAEGSSEVITAPEVPFGETHGWQFSEPAPLTIGAAQYTDAVDPEYTPTEASYAKPVIMRGPAEEEGYVTYTLTYAYDVANSFSYNYKKTKTFNAIVYGQGYYAYDYYTGLKFRTRELNTWEDETVDHDSVEPDVISVDGTKYAIHNSKTVTSEWEDPVYGKKAKSRVPVERICHTTIQITVTVPAGYDGLVFAIPLTTYEITEEDPFAEKPESTENEFWEGDAAQWVFLRASELATDEK